MAVSEISWSGSERKDLKIFPGSLERPILAKATKQVETMSLCLVSSRAFSRAGTTKFFRVRTEGLRGEAFTPFARPWRMPPGQTQPHPLATRSFNLK